MAPTKENLQFTGAQGGELAATLELPEGEPRAFALFAHCFTCSKDFLAPARISRELAERGVATLRFDFTGLGSSSGEFVDTGFSTNIDDVTVAAGFLRDNYRPPSLLLGHSLGGAAVLAATRRVEEARAVVTLAAPSRPAGLKRLVDPVADQIREQGSAEVEVAGRSFAIGRRFLQDMEDFTLSKIMEGFGAALLVLHSPADNVVDVSAAAEIFKAARHPKSFLSLDDSDHLVSDRADARWIAAVIDAWSSKYLE